MKDSMNMEVGGWRTGGSLLVLSVQHASPLLVILLLLEVVEVVEVMEVVEVDSALLEADPTGPLHVILVRLSATEPAAGTPGPYC